MSDPSAKSSTSTATSTETAAAAFTSPKSAPESTAVAKPRTEASSASAAAAQQAVLLQGARLGDASGGHAERDHHGQRRERRRPNALPHRRPHHTAL